MQKGQYIRLFMETSKVNAPIMAATNMTLHISATVEESSTKDTEEDWVENEVTGLAFDLSSDALVMAEDDENAQTMAEMLSAMEDRVDYPYNFFIAVTEGTQNRTARTFLCNGIVIPTSLRINATNRQNSTMAATFAGVGSLTIPNS